MEHPPQEESKSQMPPAEATLDQSAAYFDVHPEDIRPEYLNNLYLSLPGSEHRGMIERYGSIDIVRREEAGRRAHYQERSMRQYLQDVDDALVHLPEVQAGLERVKQEEVAIRASMQELEEKRKTLGKEIEKLPEEQRDLPKGYSAAVQAGVRALERAEPKNAPRQQCPVTPLHISA